LIDDPASAGGGEVAGDLRAPPTARWDCGCGYRLHKIAGACDNVASRLGIMPFPGTSHERFGLLALPHLIPLRVFRRVTVE